MFIVQLHTTYMCICVHTYTTCTCVFHNYDYTCIVIQQKSEILPMKWNLFFHLHIDIFSYIDLPHSQEDSLYRYFDLSQFPTDEY